MQTTRAAHRSAVYHTSEHASNQDIQRLREQAQALMSCANPHDTLVYARYPDAVADALRARDAALLLAQAEQAQYDYDLGELEYFIAHHHGCVSTHAKVVTAQRRARLDAWRAYEDAEDALTAAQAEAAQ